MKIAVVGAGAMGSLFAGYLARSREEIWAYDIWKEHIEAINREGLVMTRGNMDQRVTLNATCDPTRPSVVDVVILFCKYVHTRKAMQEARPMIGPGTLVLTLQNGIGNVDIIQEMVPRKQILFGLTTLTSELLAPGHIEESFRGLGETYFWPLNGEVNATAKQLSSILNEVGIHTEITPDVELRIWRKLIVNTCYNTLCALTGLKVGDLINQPAAWEIMNGVIVEIIQVAQRKGLRLGEEEGREILKRIAAETLNHVPSMANDVRNHKSTEIDCLNGAIMREAEKMGIPTPYNRILYNLVKIIENTYNSRLR